MFGNPVLSPDGGRIAIEGSSGGVIWDIYGEEPGVILAEYSGNASFSPDGRLVVGAVGYQETARVWSSEDGALLAELPPQPPRFPGEVTLNDPYPLPKPPPRPQYRLGGGTTSSVSNNAFELEPAARFSPSSDLVATWGRPGRGAQLWEPFGTRRLARLRAGSQASGLSLLLPTAVSADGRLVATAGRNHEIDVWSTRDGRRVARLRGSTRFVPRIAFSPTGDLVAAASHDGAVRIWRATDGRLVHTLGGHTKRVGDVAFSPDGELIASASEDGTARIWRIPDGEPVHVLRGRTGPVTSVAFSGDGDAVVTGGAGGVARVWSTDDWQERAVLGPTRSRKLVLQTSISHDGRFVATLDLAGTARIWRSDGGQPIRTLKNVASVAFSPDGEQVVVADGEATARILRTSDGADIGLLRGHEDIVNDAGFNRKGDLIVTAGQDGTVRVWQAATNGTVAVVRPSSAPVRKAMLAADGRLLIFGKDAVRLYACEPCLQPESLRALARERLAPARG